ncbi:MAG: beta-ketoacyl synthase chain length factor [Bacteroidales bacterium]|nr:beta-ketoacyl synthase chain length factor [Bacteroidales bacterium]
MKRSPVYIKASSHISAQEPFCTLESFSPLPQDGTMVLCKDPDFRPFIPPMVSRRMNSIVKRSIAVSRHVLDKAGIQSPDAIISGTGIGCVGDTEVFLNQMLDNGENMLNPSRFICSTPNTIGSQIAIYLGNRGFNSTHVNDMFAFEGALLESVMLLQKGGAENVLLCAADQMTDGLYGLLDREAFWKGIPVSEGTVGFVLSNCPEGAAAAVDDVVVTRSNPSWEVDRMLRDNSLEWKDIDAVVTSLLPGESSERFAFVPEGVHMQTYKQYCGQYFTASAFGLLYCGEVLQRMGKSGRILLASCSRGTYSFILTSSVCTN